MGSTTNASKQFDAFSPGFITDKATAFFKEQGFLVAADAVSPDQVAALNTDAAKVCRGDYGQYGGWQGPHDGQSDEDVLRQYLCIHFPHKCSPLMRDTLAHPAIVETLTHVIGPDVKCMQSMLFIKAAGKPGQAWHQDEDYIPTRDRSLCGAWIALDDATVENGCLWVVPGSQKPGVLYPQKVQDDARFDCAEESINFPYTDDDAVPVEVKAGSIVFFNGYLLHRSLPNHAPAGTYRRALVNHYMSASSLLPWVWPHELATHDTFLDHNKSIAKCDVRDIVMIAGNDPYAWMGTKDRGGTHVRPSGEGGCAKGAEPEPAQTD